MELALSVNLPTVVHSRNADIETIEAITTIKNSKGVVHCFASNLVQANKIIKLNYYISELIKLIPDQIYGYGNASMEGVVGELLKEKNRTLSTAESCTGGNVSKMLTSISGSSSFFNGSIVSYSNQSKSELLDINEQNIEKYGAVSQQVVEQMAANVRLKFNSDFGISTSGIAGPSGGNTEKPVGTIWIAVANKDKVVSKKLNLGYNRERNIHVSSLSVLNLLRLELLKN